MNNKAGLYIHIPFCKSKCPYCDFYSVKYDKALSEKYADELIKTMADYSGEFDTVYFGGGTPSILESELIAKILTSAKNRFERLNVTRQKTLKKIFTPMQNAE